MTLLTTVIEMVEKKDPSILDIGKLSPHFELAATGTFLSFFSSSSSYSFLLYLFVYICFLGALQIMLHIPSLILKLMPLEREVRSCTELSETPFKHSMQVCTTTREKKHKRRKRKQKGEYKKDKKKKQKGSGEKEEAKGSVRDRDRDASALFLVSLFIY